MALAIFAAPAHQKTNAGCGLEIHDEIGIAFELSLALGCGEGGEFQARGDLDQHLLKRPAFAFGLDHGDTHRIDRAIVFRNRAIQHAHHIVALKIGRVGQHQISKGHGLALEGITHHEEGNHVLTLVVFAVEHLAHRHGVHRAVPSHIGHEDHQRVDAVRIAFDCIGDDVVHQPVCGQRMLPRVGMINSNRRAIGVDRQLLGAGRKTQRCGVQRRVGFDHGRVVEGAIVWHDVARIRRFVSKAAGRINRAQNAHQHGERPHGLKAVGMRRQAAHRVKRHGASLGCWMNLAPSICPRNGQLKGLLQSRITHLLRELADALSRDACDFGSPLRRAALHALAQQLKRWRNARAIGQCVVAFQRRVAAIRNAFGVGVFYAVAGLIPNQFVVRVAAITGRAFFWIGIEGKQAFALPSIQHHQLRAIGEALHKRVVKLLGTNQLM